MGECVAKRFRVDGIHFSVNILKAETRRSVSVPGIWRNMAVARDVNQIRGFLIIGQNGQLIQISALLHKEVQVDGRAGMKV